VSGESRTPVAARRLARDGVHVLVGIALLGASFGIAYGTGHGGFEAGTFALAAVAALAGVVALVGARRGGRRDEQLALELRELAEIQRLALADADERRPEPTALLLLHENQGTQSARIERRRPRRLDIEEMVAHERTLALRTLPPAKSEVVDRAIGSLRIHREPSEENRNAFRRKVESYAANLREALEAYEAYRTERARLVNGRFRFENHGRGPARNVRVVAHFPDPFEIIREWPCRPVIPTRPQFHRDRTRLSALLGGDPRLTAPEEPSIGSRAPIPARSGGNVSAPRYREGSAIVEVGVERLQHAQTTDMDEQAYWTLRLPTPGEYRIPWEIHSDELEEPARGEFRLEVVELVDYTPIRSVKELLGEDEGAAQGALDEAVYRTG
jgi:hypothetical protein